jgi:ubiquinone/menaquinone biosynthesis C-methylase UbiE
MTRRFWHGPWDTCRHRQESKLSVSEPLQNNQAHVRYSAEQYDAYTAKYVARFDEILAARIVEAMAGRPPEATLLDVGTGTARLLIYLAAIPALQQMRFVGTDVFEDMVARAQETVSAAGLSDRIDVRLEDVHAMRFADGFADIAISRSTIHHWSQPAQAFREIYRVLKPGGVAILHDVRRDPAPEAIADFNAQRAKAGLPPSHLEEKFTVAEVTEFLREANLASASRVKSSSKGIAALGYEVVIEKPLS